MKILALLLCALLLVRCGVPTQNDIYEVYPIGSRLDAATLERAGQLIVTSQHRILLVDLSDDVDRVEPHLLFYGTDLHLHAGCYFPSGHVTAVSHDTLFAELNEYLDDRAGAYRADLPPEIVIVYRPGDASTGRRSDKIIDKVEVRTEDMCLRLFVREADQWLAGMDWSPGRDTSGLSSRFHRPDTFELSLHELTWDADARRLNKYGQTWWGDFVDQMIVPDEMVWKGLFKDLYALISVATKPDAPRPAPIPLAK